VLREWRNFETWALVWLEGQAAAPYAVGTIPNQEKIGIQGV